MATNGFVGSSIVRRAERSVLACMCALSLLSGCDRDGRDTLRDGADAATPDSRSTAPPMPASALPAARDACELLPAEEVSALLGVAIEARREVLERADQSICAYAPKDGWSVLYITAWWSGGRTEWERRPLAQQRERILDGIGDGAYYGGLLPSAVVSGDVLLEFAMPLLPDEQAHFPVLAQKAVSRL